MSDKINISNSTVGVVNTGEIKEIKSILVSTSALTEAGHSEVATALRQLADAVSKNQELSDKQRTEILAQLDEIARQANTPAEKRSALGVIRSILSGIATGLGAAGGLAEVWSTWGPAIAKFFGL